MLVRQVMTQGVEIADPTTTLQEAAKRMRSLNVGPLPVLDGERLIGIVTDRDITIRATAEGRDPAETQVREVMTLDTIHCYADQDVLEAARLMSDFQVRRLPVLDRKQRLVGIVSLGDLAVRDTDLLDDGVDEAVLVHVSAPPHPRPSGADSSGAYSLL